MLLQNIYQYFDVQSQQIEKHPGVTSGTLNVKRLKNILEQRQVRSKSTD
jgi:hypothetical protein